MTTSEKPTRDDPQPLYGVKALCFRGRTTSIILGKIKDWLDQRISAHELPAGVPSLLLIELDCDEDRESAIVYYEEI